MAGAGTAIEYAAQSRRPSRRFALILSSSQPPASRPMAPTAPTEIAETLLACLKPISGNRCRNRGWKALMAYMVKMWEMPDRMRHHQVGSFGTAGEGALTAAPA